LSFGSGGSDCSSSQAHLPHVSLLSQPGTRPGIRPVIQDQPPGEAATLVSVSCRLSVTGIRFLGILFPPKNWALLTVGLPAHQLAGRTRTGFPCSARMRHDWGWMSSIPRGRRCPHGRECSTTAACRITTAQSLSPRHYIPTQRVTLTRHHRGFPFSHPIPSLPLTCGPRTGQGLLGFPVSSAPSRHRPRTSRWGQVSDTDPKSRRRHQPTSNQRTHSPRATSCRRHFACLPVLDVENTCAPSPCARLSRTLWQVVTPATTTGTPSP
jgi:hypothetical protein